MLAVIVAGAFALMPPAEPEPSLADLARFPSAEEVQRWLRFNETYQKTCQREASAAAWSFQRDWWAAAWIESERMAVPWQYLACAQQSENGGEALRLDYLRYVRAEIGPRRYWSGVMPPPVPFWRFRAIEGNPNAR